MATKVNYTGPVEGLDEEQIQDISDFINKCDYAVIGTWSQQAGVRLAVLTNLREQFMDELTFVTVYGTEKVEQIRQNPTCELLFARKKGEVTFTGQASIEPADEALKTSGMTAWVSNHLSIDIDPDTLCYIKIRPTTLRAAIRGYKIYR